MVDTLLTDLPHIFRRSTLRLLKAAYANGTWKNKINHMISYTQFVRTYKLSLLNPSKYQVMGYITYLYNKYHVPGTVFNYLSGAKTWIKMNNGNTSAFDGYYVTLLKKGVSKAAVHKVRQATPLRINDIKKITHIFDESGVNAYVFKSVTLIAYFSLLRQSNLVCSGLAGSSSHVVLQKDIEVVHDNLKITVRSTKTSCSSQHQYIVIIPRSRRPKYCPVHAWEKYYELAPKGPDLPAFWMKGGIPLCATYWLKMLRYALRKSNNPTPYAYTLHSLRRGSAQACIMEGMPASKVKEAGRWSSDAMYSYVPRAMVKAVPAALSKIFG